MWPIQILMPRSVFRAAHGAAREGLSRRFSVRWLDVMVNASARPCTFVPALVMNGPSLQCSCVLRVFGNHRYCKKAGFPQIDARDTHGYLICLSYRSYFATNLLVIVSWLLFPQARLCFYRLKNQLINITTLFGIRARLSSNLNLVTSFYLYPEHTVRRESSIAQ